MTAGYDVAVVGAGIVGLAHALAAARRGLSVVVVERGRTAQGASIRNFGFVTVTGQAAGDCWQLARRSAQVWQEVAQDAGIAVLHKGLVVTARRPEAEAVLDAFIATDMGEGCRRLTREEALERTPALGPVTAALYSPHELRVESRTAVPQIAAWLAERHGVTFHFGTAVREVAAPKLKTSRGDIAAQTIIVCPGDDAVSLFPERLAAYALGQTTLQMLRVMPRQPFTLGAAVMSDLGLARYKGYADLPEAAALAARLDLEQPQERANGIHLIVVQSADGSLVIGDSHQDGDIPFRSQEIDDLILQEAATVLELGDFDVAERWLGTYATSPDRWRLTDAPDDATRIVVVTAGCGASTAFGIGEETIADLFGAQGT